MKFCRGEELQPFPSQYSPFFHLFICQPSINYRPSPSLSTLPSSYLLFLLHFPATSVVPYIPLSLSIYLIPSQPSHFPLYLPLPTFPVPTFPLSYLSLSLPSPFLTLPFFPRLPFSFIFFFSFSLHFPVPFYPHFFFLFSGTFPCSWI